MSCLHYQVSSSHVKLPLIIQVTIALVYENKKALKKHPTTQVSRKYHWITDPIRSSPHLLNCRRWCHLANTLNKFHCDLRLANLRYINIFNNNKYCEQVNRQNLHVKNSHRQHAARLFQTVRAAFSAEAACAYSFAVGVYELKRCLSTSQTSVSTTWSHHYLYNIRLSSL